MFGKNLISDFELYFPSQYSRMKTYREYSIDSLLIETRGGQLIVYDGAEGSIRNVYISDDSDKMFAIEFGANLNHIRLSRCLSQNDLAKRLGATPRTVSRYLHGETLPDALTVHKLAEVLGCEYDVLLDIPTKAEI